MAESHLSTGKGTIEMMLTSSKVVIEQVKKQWNFHFFFFELKVKASRTLAIWLKIGARSFFPETVCGRTYVRTDVRTYVRTDVRAYGHAYKDDASWNYTVQLRWNIVKRTLISWRGNIKGDLCSLKLMSESVKTQCLELSYNLNNTTHKMPYQAEARYTIFYR